VKVSISVSKYEREESGSCSDWEESSGNSSIKSAFTY
jgi:hypothetical protein